MIHNQPNVELWNSKNKNKKWTKKIWVNTTNSQKLQPGLWDNDNSIEKKSK